jgi:hypothetical protein
MRFTRFLAAVSAASLAALSVGPAAAQVDDKLPVPKQGVGKRPTTPPPVQGRNPAVTHLMQLFKLSEAEARERIDIQNLVTDLADNSSLTGEAGYSDIWIEHEPVFKVVIGFTDRDERAAFVQGLDPKLRRHVQVRNVKYTRAQTEATVNQLVALLGGAKLDFDTSYKPQNGKFVVTVADNSAAQKARDLIPPALRGDVEVRVGRTMQTEQSTAPTGVLANDYAEGGMTIHHSFPDRTEGQPWCTVGYSITYGSGKRGIVTAGHCEPPLHLYINDHYIRLGDPLVSRATTWSGIYDYALYDIGTALADPWIRFKDYNAIPEFPDSGWFSVSNWVSRANQKVGYTACKSGYATGITCGLIASTYAGSTGKAGYVEVDRSNQERLSAPGDSGGPWFYHPGSATSILALGVHSSGIKGGCSGLACRSWYMPIDLIDDHNSTVRIATR